MARKKIRLAWIGNESARRATFKKRRKGLMKKVAELSVLCDVKACAIVFDGPPTQQHQQQRNHQRNQRQKNHQQQQHSLPEVWPSPSAAMRILSKFRSMPQTEQNKKMMDQVGFLTHRNARVGDQLARLDAENRQLHATLLLSQALADQSRHGTVVMDSMEAEDLTVLAWAVEIKLQAVHDRIDTVKRKLLMAQQQQQQQGKQQKKAKDEEDHILMKLKEKEMVHDRKSTVNDHEWFLFQSAMNSNIIHNASSSASSFGFGFGSAAAAGPSNPNANYINSEYHAVVSSPAAAPAPAPAMLSQEEQQLLYGRDDISMMMMTMMKQPPNFNAAGASATGGRGGGAGTTIINRHQQNVHHYCNSTMDHHPCFPPIL